MKPKLKSQETTDVVNAMLYNWSCILIMGVEKELIAAQLPIEINEEDVKRIVDKLKKTTIRYKNDLSSNDEFAVNANITEIFTNLGKRTKNE